MIFYANEVKTVVGSLYVLKRVFQLRSYKALYLFSMDLLMAHEKTFSANIPSKQNITIVTI